MTPMPFARRRGVIPIALLAVLAMLAAPAPLRAQDAAAPDTSPLSAHVSYTQFVQGTVAGGLEHDASYGGRIDVTARVDTRLLGLWRGGSLNAKLATRYGRTPEGDAGVVVPVSAAMIDPADQGTATGLITLQYTQELALSDRPGDLLLLAVGKFSTVDLAPEALLGGSGITRFMNLDFLAPPDEGRNIPSVSNGGSLAIVLGGQPVFSLAVLDPQPSQRTSGLDSLFAKGVALSPAVIIPTRFFGLPGHQQLRGTWSNQRVTPFEPIPQLILPHPGGDTTGVKREHGPWTLTWSADQFFAASPGPPATGWGMFWMVSVAPSRTNAVSRFVNVGFAGNSPFRGRTQDLWGVGYAWIGLGEDFRDLFQPLLELRDEHMGELFYNLALAPWARLTADLQVIRPARPRVDTVVIPGARLQLVF